MYGSNQFQLEKRIDASDVVSLLREVYPEGVKGRNEAEALIAFDRELFDPAPEWRGFMAEAVADHLVRRSAPLGMIDNEKADWLIGALAPAGRIATRAGIEALLRVIESASQAPTALTVYAIRELCAEIIAGEGPALDGRPHVARTIDKDDVALLRRMLEAGAATAGAAVTREEAEALFDLHDAVAGSDNDPAFDDLFFYAIANHMVGASGFAVEPRETALAHEPQRDAAANIGPEQCAWLALRIMRDGMPTPAERALLTLITQGTEPDPSLRRLVNRAA